MLQYYEEVYGKPPSEGIVRFLKYCLMQQVWLLLLRDEFMEAYELGMLILCYDGVLRRVFPRIFFYSADYPEKHVSLVTTYVRLLRSDASSHVSNA